MTPFKISYDFFLYLVLVTGADDIDWAKCDILRVYAIAGTVTAEIQWLTLILWHFNI